MWEKVKIRERDRVMGMLFVGICAALLGWVILALVSSVAAQAAATVLAGILCLFGMAMFWRYRRNKPGHPPTGPLSRDERAKARSKLLKPKAGV